MADGIPVTMPTPEIPAQLAGANTLALPCEASALLTFGDDDALLDALVWCEKAQLRPLVLGEGSNVVLPETLRRAVLRSADQSVTVLEDRADGVQLRVGAGKNWHALVTECLAAGWYGLENLALIPGSMGAAPVQNIGAYGVELATFVAAVHGVDLSCNARQTLTPEDCAFAYRHSVFKAALNGRFIISAVDLCLSRKPETNVTYAALGERLARLQQAPTPAAVYRAVVGLRRERLPDPATEPNAGSFFKNPVLTARQAAALKSEHQGLPVYPAGQDQAKVAAAWLIEACGFKGVQRGPVGVAEEHALVLVNHGGAQRDVLALAGEISAAVRDRFGCELEIEPVVYRGE